MHELYRVLEREVWEFTSCILGSLESSALDRAAEADVSVRSGGQEHMCP